MFSELAHIAVMIVALVGYLVIFVIFRHICRSKRFFVRARMIEILLTTIPHALLGGLMSPSLSLLYMEVSSMAVGPFRVSASAGQWYWAYELASEVLGMGMGKHRYESYAGRAGFS
jgi:heme/copper-type cytochrome/quinol oxidase subunit 2